MSELIANIGNKLIGLLLTFLNFGDVILQLSSRHGGLLLILRAMLLAGRELTDSDLMVRSSLVFC